MMPFDSSLLPQQMQWAQQARARQLQNMMQGLTGGGSPLAYSSGPLPDPTWDALMEGISQGDPKSAFMLPKLPRMGAGDNSIASNPTSTFNTIGPRIAQPGQPGQPGAPPIQFADETAPPTLAKKRLKGALGGINKAGGVPSSGPYDPTSQTT